MSSPLITRLDRQRLARERLAEAEAALAECRLCAHDCGVNRLAGEFGRCEADASARIFSRRLEAGDELELAPALALSFSGCDLRCVFCNTQPASWRPEMGDEPDYAALAHQAEEALSDGARSLMLLGGEPTIHLPTVLRLVAVLPLTARLVWKTNGHATAPARALLRGLFEVWLADYKFGNEACARQLSGATHYVATVRENLAWAHADSELIVRHQLLPGHVECCWRPIAAWLSENLPGAKTSLRTGFWPAAQAPQPELRRPLWPAERQQAEAIAREHQLHLIE